MKKQLGILLLAFIAAVGISGAIAAAPPMQGPGNMQGPMHGPSFGHYPGHMYCHYVFMHHHMYRCCWFHHHHWCVPVFHGPHGPMMH